MSCTLNATILESLLKYLFGERNTMEVCKDLEELGVKWHLWLHIGKLLAPYVFTWNERQAFVALVSSIHALIEYPTAFKKHVGPNKLYNMKSCDHHVMLQNILLATIQNLLHPGPKRVIIYLGKTFQKLCTKVVNPNDIPNFKIYVAKTLCMLEIKWPSTFFDLQTHFIIHFSMSLYMQASMPERHRGLYIG
jgi:hypothetical protein